jgi:hypothetical protein
MNLPMTLSVPFASTAAVHTSQLHNTPWATQKKGGKVHQHPCCLCYIYIYTGIYMHT